MSKRKLEDEFLDNNVGKSNPLGKRPKSNEAYPNERPMNHDFYRYFKKRIIPKYFKEGAPGYIKHHQTIKELQQDTRIPDPGTVHNLRLVTGNTMVVSADGKPILFFVENGLQLPFNYSEKDKKFNPLLEDFDIAELALNAILKLVDAYPPPKPKVKDRRHLGSKIAGDPKNGLYHFAFWQESGHGNADKEKLDRGAFINAESYPSQGKAKGQARNLGAVFRYHSDMTPVFQAMGSIFELLDFENYNRYQARYRELAAETDLRLFNTTSKNCFLGSALIAGLQCNPHKDMNDVMDGWVMDAAFGDFEGGNLQCHQLGLEFPLGGSHLVMMRSRLLTHGVSPVTRGQRFSTVLFTHNTMIKTHSQMLDELEADEL